MGCKDLQQGGEFAGRVALVTGGSRGIGRAVALELARRGAHIAFNYFRSHGEARAVQQEVEALEVRCLRVPAHLGDPAKITELFAQVEQAYGRLDILVNNAASGVARPALELEEKHWDWTLDINTRAPWLCAREAARVMTQGGHIVNITSLGSQRVLPYYTAVGVSKAGLEALTRYLAVELAPRGISVNAVSAGVVETEALRYFPNRQEMLASARTKTPAGRLLTPEDVARVVAFLCSKDAAMVRGQVIVVDGGYSLVV
ncbi:MAG: enoyl-[acyl-carrier-protein] reductase FabL [Chloroflexi bacterium]|nr:enoyl-[acyl-carrier-protein] reductase FabL [Chloroflexota bacterium]